MWFEAGRRLSRDHQLRGCGCGLVAALDFCVYKGGFPPSSEQEEYRERIRELNRHYFFVVPFLGIAPYYYPLMVNRERNSLKACFSFSTLSWYSFRLWGSIPSIRQM